MTEETANLDFDVNRIKEMFDDLEQKYICNECKRKYKTTGGLKRHLKTEHEWEFASDTNSDDKSKYDHIALYRASFMKCALFLRDTTDAFKICDGERITTNAKFQMLLSRVGNHTKYQLWLFRYLANCLVLLPPRLAYEYMWNCGANLHGGINHNIPNDNLVEILVQMAKKKLHSQGSNATFESVRRAALTMPIQQEIKDNMEKECHVDAHGTRRPAVNKRNDIVAMVSELKSVNVFDNIPGREYNSFKLFKDVFSRVKPVELHKWLNENRERLSFEAL